MVGRATLILLIAAGSIAAGLWITPMQVVHAAGQTVQVGAATPSLDFSGPGELDLFGQRIPTVVQFAGPVRPRLRLTHITLSSQLAEFARSGSSEQLGNALEAGWQRFFYWEIAVVGVAALILSGAIAGWLRRNRRATVLLIATGLLLSETINVAAIMVTAYTAPQRLSRVHSLQALVGSRTVHLRSPPSVRHPPPGDRRVVVLGDSTAAGLGNPLVPHPTPVDRACGRSRDSYARDLARANAWQVTNLACSGASIASGLLGTQQVGEREVPPQLRSDAVRRATVVIVSIGANDVHWSDVLRACAISASCANKATDAYFQKQLATFSRTYLDLLSQLEVLPNHPRVLINLYYNPFPGPIGCLKSSGLTDDKRAAMLDDLNALNSILRDGAQAASFAAVAPDFSGHGLCSTQPYVQGVTASAPFHPNAGGELAIALADEAEMNDHAAS